VYVEYIYIYTLYNIRNILVWLATIINALSDVCPFHQVASRNCLIMSGPQSCWSKLTNTLMSLAKWKEIIVYLGMFIYTSSCFGGAIVLLMAPAQKVIVC